MTTVSLRITKAKDRDLEPFEPRRTVKCRNEFLHFNYNPMRGFPAERLFIYWAGESLLKVALVAGIRGDRRIRPPPLDFSSFGESMVT